MPQSSPRHATYGGASEHDDLGIAAALSLWRAPGPAAQWFLDLPLPCSKEELQASEERLAAQERAAARQSPEEYLAKLKRTVADPNAEPILIKMSENLIAMYEERRSAIPDRAKEDSTGG